MQRRQFLGILTGALLTGSLGGCGLSVGDLFNCQVSDNYREGVGEIEWLMIKIRLMNGSDASLLDEPATARLYLQSLESARRAYERRHNDLPRCARPLNERLIATLRALEEVLAARMAGWLEHDPRAFEELNTSLSQHWSDYVQTKDATLRSGGVLEGKLNPR